jgi:hypothetical protein
MNPTRREFRIFITMDELMQFEAGNSAIARKADGNPEGKGVNGFLFDWDKSEPKGVVAKSQQQLLAEFFTSLLVLSAQFKFKPAIGVPNHLYWINDKWSLSLIAPYEWSEERQAGFAATCVLHRDMTWTISPSSLLAESNAVSDAVGRFYDAFAKTLDTDHTLEQVLPFYVGNLTYYPRLYASALSRSLRAAMILGDQTSISCRDWKLCLPRIEQALLPRTDLPT